MLSRLGSPGCQQQHVVRDPGTLGGSEPCSLLNQLDPRDADPPLHAHTAQHPRAGGEELRPTQGSSSSPRLSQAVFPSTRTRSEDGTVGPPPGEGLGDTTGTFLHMQLPLVPVTPGTPSKHTAPTLLSPRRNHMLNANHLLLSSLGTISQPRQLSSRKDQCLKTGILNLGTFQCTAGVGGCGPS